MVRSCRDLDVRQVDDLRALLTSVLEHPGLKGLTVDLEAFEAAESETDPALRNSFLELATAYDRLALTLQRVGSLVRR